MSSVQFFLSPQELSGSASFHADITGHAQQSPGLVFVQQI